MKLKFASLATLALAFAACATPSFNYQPAVREISEPPLGVVSTATVGDSMVRQGRYVEHDGIRLAQKITIGILSPYYLTAGDYRKTGENANGSFYLPSKTPGSGGVTWAGMADPLEALMLKDDGQICAVSNFGSYSCGQGTGITKVKVPIIEDNAFQQTLIYSGKVGDKINVGYREFSNDTARPAFNNDVEYDLKESMTIGYKGAVIEVIEATNQVIRFRVVKNFNKASY